MTHPFKSYSIGEAKFATAEKDGKFCFTGQGLGVFDDGGEGHVDPLLRSMLFLLVR